MAIQMTVNVGGADSTVQLLEPKDFVESTKSGSIRTFTAGNKACNAGTYVADMWTVTVPANFVLLGWYLEYKGSGLYYEPQIALTTSVTATSLVFCGFVCSYNIAGSAAISADAYTIKVIGYVNV